MLGILLDQLMSSGKLKALIVRYAFYSFNGILGGIFMNDIIRILFGDVNLKHSYQYLIAGTIGGSGYIYRPLSFFGDPNNNLALGAGVALGHYWAELSEKGEKINVVPN